MNKLDNVFEKTLILSPHYDDETIGCGGLLSRISESGYEALIVQFASCNNKTCNSGRPVSDSERVAEFKNAIHKLDPTKSCISYKLLNELTDEYEFKDGSLDMVSKKVYVTLLDKLLDQFKPTAVLFPYPSFNQDHKLVNEVSLAALRPVIATNSIRLKAMYEYPYYDSWNSSKLIAKSYVILDESVMNTKMDALHCYKSQLVRDPRDLLDKSAIQDLARIRGREVSQYYAEAYYPLITTY